MIICPNCGKEAIENSKELWKDSDPDPKGWWNHIDLVDRYCPNCRCFWNSSVSNMHIFPEGSGVFVSIKLSKDEEENEPES